MYNFAYSVEGTQRITDCTYSPHQTRTFGAAGSARTPSFTDRTCGQMDEETTQALYNFYEKFCRKNY